MQTWLDLASLQSLRIENCRNVAHLFTGLANKFRYLEETALVRLTVLQEIRSSIWVDALAEFLGCFDGLTTLFVSSKTRERLNMRSVGHHGQTLKHLHIDILTTTTTNTC